MSDTKVTRYVEVGIGHRSTIYTDAMGKAHRATSALVGMQDKNRGRMELRLKTIKEQYGYPDVALYDDFETMIKEQKPDVVIVTAGPDVTHDELIIKAMELGCDVITEKPMTIDPERCQRIIDASKRTGKNVRVTFNYRYSPPRSQVKEILDAGTIGKVLSVDFEWALDTSHGADYFRRWHRKKENSGGLMVHKATHHFDLMNWWLSEKPASVSAIGRRGFYGADSGSAEHLGLQNHSERCLDCPCAAKCQFYLDLNKSENLRTYYLENEKYDGYFRDKCVFSKDMNIEDNMNVIVKYESGTLMSYTLNAFLPWEGYRIAFNGTKGRLEHGTVESTYIAGDGRVQGGTIADATYIRLLPAFSTPENLTVRVGAGGHGGGDDVMLADIFDPNAPRDPLKRAAGIGDGSYSILVGAAANISMKTGKVVEIADLIKNVPTPSWES